jgi:predicted urease superfamily metal-dependent hydrolase
VATARQPLTNSPFYFIIGGKEEVSYMKKTKLKMMLPFVAAGLLTAMGQNLHADGCEYSEKQGEMDLYNEIMKHSKDNAEDGQCSHLYSSEEEANEDFKSLLEENGCKEDNAADGQCSYLYSSEEEANADFEKLLRESGYEKEMSK